MKYSIFVLVIASLLFSQDPYRLNDSTFVYPCTYPMIDNMDSMTCYNFVALPLDAGFTRASDLDTNATNLDVVAKWNSELRGWESACYNSYFGWVNDFNVEVGQSYLINVKREFDFIVTGDSVDMQPYDFMVGKLNSFMVPLSRASALDTRDLMGESDFYCTQLYGYSPETQNWKNDGASFTPTPFEISSGMALMGLADRDFIWPNVKSSTGTNFANYTKQKKANNSQTKSFFCNVIDKTGNSFGYSVDKATFKAWIKPRPNEVISQDNVGCGQLYLENYTVVYLDVSAFPTYCSLGDTLIIQVKDEKSYDFNEWTYGEARYVIKNGGAEFLGFEDVIPGSGNPIQTNIPTSIDNGHFTVNSFDLKQNYPNPFNNATMIPYELKENSDVKINIYNAKGEIACEVTLGKQSKGIHNYKLNANELTAGIYYYSLVIDGNAVDRKKMLFLK
jgi:hypothetical protein